MQRLISLAGARVTAGLTQQEMADKLGIHRSHVNAMENGKAPIRPAYLIAWASITGFDVKDIFLPSESTEKITDDSESTEK